MNYERIETVHRGEPVTLLVDCPYPGNIGTLKGVLFIDDIDVISLLHPDDIADLQMEVDAYLLDSGNKDDFNPSKDAWTLGE